MCGYTYVMDTDEVTAAEAAKILDVSERHVRWYHANGHLPGRRIGKWMLVFKRADVEALKDNKPKKTGRPKVKAEPAAKGKSPRKRKGGAS